jgi:hypothetical protein
MSIRISCRICAIDAYKIIPFLMCLLCGCGGQSEFPIAPVSGVVTCEGKPVPGAQVFFEPLQTGESALVGKQGYAAANEKGEFVITTYDSGDGAVIGKHAVHVLAPNAEYSRGFKCPCEFDSKTQPIEVEVQKGGKNEFTFVLPLSKTKNVPLNADQREALEEAKQQNP